MRLQLSLNCLLVTLLGASTFARQLEPAKEPVHFMQVTSRASLIHLGSLDSFDITEGGTQAGSLLFDCLGTKNPESAREAAAIYERIIPSENFGGEYTALQWLCEFFFASKSDQKKMLADPVTAAWYKYLAQDNFEPLKDYLKKKYHLLEWKDRRTPKSEPKFRFLEDFLLFNNPRRERWEKTSKILEVLGLKKGDVVADIGCGPGYYSFKFAELVGPSGYVYAEDINKQHIEYVGKLIKELGVKNIETVLPKEGEDLRLARKADLAFLCSLYHNIYALDTDGDRDKFVAILKNNLKPDGTLVVVDNGLVEETKMPYHGPHIARELIINQLWYYGFRLVKSYQFIPQRYVLVFKLMPGPEPSPTKFTKPLPDDCVPFSSKSSLIRFLKTANGPGFTLPGRKAARLMHAALDKKEPATIRAALEAYQDLIPKERFGDEYLALQWFCEYLLASPQKQQQEQASWLVGTYFDRLAADDYKMLKTYLRYKYYLDAVVDDDDLKRAGPGSRRLEPHDLEVPESAPVTQDQLNEWGEFIAFTSPYRENWEKTSKVLKFLKIKPGDQVADLGCGPGYYTFKFSELVGREGHVYAVDTMPSMTNYINEVCQKRQIHNVETILARDNNTRLPADSVDLIYICSMYHAVYMISMEYVKDGFFATLKPALRKGARVVIADNAILKDSENPYYGPRIAPELIITQMKQYGFRLVDRTQFIPQRYVLVFQTDP
jgi:ubiquinone/menaquinone biosynthesis C-methylase UbiE